MVVGEKISSFLDNRSGNVAIITGFILVLMIFFGGVAVDKGRATAQRVSGQEATDAAVLAHLRTYLIEADKGVARTSGISMFESNLRNHEDWTLQLDEIIEEDGYLVAVGTAQRFMPTMIVAVAGKEDIEINVRSVARIPIRTTSVVVVPDISYSMRGAALRAAKDAMETFSEELYSMVPEFRRGLEMSLVPYAGSVNVSRLGGDVSSRLTNWTYLDAEGTTYIDKLHYLDPAGGCERTEEVLSGPNFRVTEYFEKDVVIPGVIQPDGSVGPSRTITICADEFKRTQRWSGCLQHTQDEFSNLSAPLKPTPPIPPTLHEGRHIHCPGDDTTMETNVSSEGQFNRLIRGLRVGFGTSHDLGLLWAHRTLDPVMAGTVGAAGHPWRSEDHKKYVLFLSDGRSIEIGYLFDEYSGLRTKKLITANAKVVCDSLKDNEVTVVGVSFRTGGPAEALEVVEDCASPRKHYSSQMRELERLLEDVSVQIKTDGMFLSR